jgi:hypothetical protein
MSHFFLVGTFFLRHSEEVSVDPFTSTVCDRLNTDDEHDSHKIRQNSGNDLSTLLPQYELKGTVEVGFSSRFINDIRFRRRVLELIRHICHPCLYRAQDWFGDLQRIRFL